MSALWANVPFTESDKFSGRRLHLGVSGSVGFNDQPNAKYLIPSLATVHIPAAQLGYAALDLLLDKQRTQREYPKRVYLDTKFVIRNSVKEI